ncbi:hypothetical protein D3C79_821210 [compost metagenome]
MNIVISVKALTKSGAEVNSIIIPLIAIIMLAIHFALRGTVPLARQSRNVGPYLGWFNNQSSICGQPLEAAQAARIKNTVVSIPGKIAPIMPSVIKNTTKERQNNVRIYKPLPAVGVSIKCFSNVFLLIRYEIRMNYFEY